ncbi:hypothetical protein BKK80_02905 [Cupriavidus malaysiensis]|uniref:Sigma-54 factor interaction domain-containing protein n=1 Tax=Cupriavidus malaysiensis TaxID=367825 RepID=A0ABN4TLL4_9BURK|nr:helix-turn-helix domain-containing protein [Cupriavidus malaysiensis]AOZ04894.1 hypothetical protein BKK80_02905 [Cupriavidus malaysiensis]
MPVPEIAPDVARHLATRRWPGNLRQLRQKIEEALVFCDGHRLRVADFARGEGSLAAVLAETPPAGLAPATAQVATALDAPAPVDAPPTPQADAPLRALAHEAVLQAITRHGGNKKQAAHALGIPRSHLYQILARGERA